MLVIRQLERRCRGGMDGKASQTGRNKQQDEQLMLKKMNVMNVMIVVVAEKDAGSLPPMTPPTLRMLSLGRGDDAERSAVCMNVCVYVILVSIRVCVG